MRIVPIIVAVLVTATLYMLVIERDTLMALVSGEAVDVAAELATPGNDDPAQTEMPTPIAEKQAQEPVRVVRVVAMHSTARQIDSAVVLRGQTEATRQVSVTAETSGTVISEPIRKGAFVSTGDELCRIDPGTRASSLAEAEARLAEARAQVPATQAQVPQARAALAQAEAQLEEARLNDNASRKLSEGGFASETRVASTQASVRSAEAAVESAKAGVESARSGITAVEAAIQSAEAAVASARQEIDKLTVTAPFDGILESDTAELGSYLNPQGGNATCATILQLDPIRLVGYVPEAQVNRVEIGAMAGARLTTGEELRGRVSFLSRSADPATRTFRVEVIVDNGGLQIRDGQTAEILIAAEGAPAHLIPQSALTLNDEGDLGVRLVVADMGDEGAGDEAYLAEFAPVTMIRDTANGVWVAGLPEDADVILIGQEYVTDGTAVEPEWQEATQ
ncbi:efflux RND transporter periplasmic adaptor subunit [Mesobacterium pallidum]|uniref:efflux RND transporter periplasmic adaptor subunit n=1 Tax=Mesobacterium pallidum TaxID=2872037 RepID=UPI001EE39C0B|nr:efflux RND transporter periplasmic adaptor subunit [Mesobacterium pallidum]